MEWVNFNGNKTSLGTVVSCLRTLAGAKVMGAELIRLKIPIARGRSIRDGYHPGCFRAYEDVPIERHLGTEEEEEEEKEDSEEYHGW